MTVTDVPLVSIGLPVFNGERFLEKAIVSILDQEFENLELIISDNASTDHTGTICQDYALTDSRISYTKLHQNMGAAYNYNYVFHQSSGQYFKWATHDDLIEPKFISRCIEVMNHESRKGRTPSIIYPKSRFIDELGMAIEPDYDRMHTTSRSPAVRVFSALQSMNMVAAVFGLMPRQMMTSTGLIGNFPSSDYVFLTEAAMLGEIIQFDEVLFLRRIHPGMSRLANKTKDEVVRWFDPESQSKLSIRQRLYLEYLRAAWNMKDIGPVERSTCMAAVAVGVPFRRSHVLAGRWKHHLINWLNHNQTTD